MWRSLGKCAGGVEGRIMEDLSVSGEGGVLFVMRRATRQRFVGLVWVYVGRVGGRATSRINACINHGGVDDDQKTS